MFDKKLLLQHISNQDLNEQKLRGRILGEPDPVPDNSIFPGAGDLKKSFSSPENLTKLRKTLFGQTVGEKRAAKMSGKNIGIHKSKPGEKPEVFAARYKKENDPFKPRFPFRTVTKRKPSKGGGLITPFSRSRNMNEGTHTVSVSLDPNGAGYIYGNSGHNAFSFESEKPSGELRSLVSDHDHGHLHIQQITKVHTNKNRERLDKLSEGAPEGAPIKDKNKIGASVAAAVKKLMKPGYEDPDTPTASPPARSSGGY
tara:strand:+ start:1236 stop:2003 length:768 start_codon:yes stop_codon:yes gene_type:complete